MAENDEQPQVVAYSTTCFCPQPDDGSDLLDANDACLFCGTQWKV